jgi:hypothetical protein
MKYKIKKGLISQNLGKKITIFDGENSLLYTFNETAAFIFTQIKRGLTKESVISNLSLKYKITLEKARRDTEDLLKELIKKGVIE